MHAQKRLHLQPEWHLRPAFTHLQLVHLPDLPQPQLIIPRWGARWSVLSVHLARPPRAPVGIPRAPESPCRVLQSIDWEGEQALFELTLVDALHCDRLRTDQAGQRQGAMVDPSRRHQQLSGDVR